MRLFFHLNESMNKKTMMLAVCAVMLLAACSGKKERKATGSELIEDVARFGIDTIEAKPGDMLCDETVDGVLRHYPELYHATQKAKKAYEKWAEQSEQTHLNMKTKTMDIAAILQETFFGEQTVDADSAWQYLNTIDSLYIQAIGSVPDGQPDTDMLKSSVGRTRKAWQAYTQRLQDMTSTIPTSCTQRFLSTIKDKTRSLTDENYYKRIK